MLRHKKLVLLCSFCGICGTPLCGDASVPQWLQGSTVKGFVSMYDWTSINHYFSPYDQYTLSVGGGLFLETPRYDGFDLAIEPMGQSGLGTHASNSNLVSPTLGPSFTTLGQAYIQYKKYGLDAKVGDMELTNTPWNGSDNGYRILPITFQGVGVNYNPIKDLNFYFSRIYKWRYFNQEHYNRETAYSIYLPDDKMNSSGFLSVGLDYKGKVPGLNYINTNSELWFYNYYQYDRLYLAQSVNSIGDDAYKGIIGLQFMHAGKRDGYLGNVNAQLYGVEAGVKNSFAKVLVAYDFMPTHLNSFNYGGLATPYDTITDSGPIFAQPVMTSTQDLGSGTATGIKIDFYGIPHLFTQLRYTHLHMRTSPAFVNYNEYNLIISYNISYVKGLNISDIASYANEHPSHNPNFYQNRLMLVYNF